MLHHYAQLGSAVERIGNAAAPGSLLSTAPRPSETMPAPFRSAYAGGMLGLDVFVAPRSRGEALVDNGRAREYQREARVIGSAVGTAAALVAAAYLSRGARK